MIWKASNYEKGVVPKITKFEGWGLYLHIRPLIAASLLTYACYERWLELSSEIERANGTVKKDLIKSKKLCLDIWNDRNYIQKYNGSKDICHFAFQSYPHYRMHYDSSLS